MKLRWLQIGCIKGSAQNSSPKVVPFVGLSSFWASLFTTSLHGTIRLYYEWKSEKLSRTGVQQKKSAHWTHLKVVLRIFLPLWKHSLQRPRSFTINLTMLCPCNAVLSATFLHFLVRLENSPIRLHAMHLQLTWAVLLETGIMFFWLHIVDSFCTFYGHIEKVEEHPKIILCCWFSLVHNMIDAGCKEKRQFVCETIYPQMFRQFGKPFKQSSLAGFQLVTGRPVTH